MIIHRRSAAVFLSMALTVAVLAHVAAQESKPTIRHHRVAEEVPDDSSSPEVDQAETAMQHSDFTTAESLLQKAVTAKPNDYRAWFDLGYVYNATQRRPQAIDAYRKSVAAKPDVFESNLNLGILLAGQGDKVEAAKYLKAATQLKPTANPEEGLARAWQSLGRVEEDSDPQQALAAYAEAAKLNPKAPSRISPPGFCWRSRTSSTPQRASSRWPRNSIRNRPEALAGLANVAMKQKKYPEAEAALRKLLAADPRTATRAFNWDASWQPRARAIEAAAGVAAGTQRPIPSDPHAALELGTLYVKAGKDSEAEQQFRVAVQKMPQDAEAHYALGSLLMHEKKYPEAQQELLLAVKLKPDLAEAYGNLAVVASENKNYELALQALDYRAKFLPESPASYFLRATCFDNLKAVKQAVEYYQRFLAADAGKLPDQEWQARHRLMALDPQHADKYQIKKK